VPCTGGDFLGLSKESGFADPRLTESRPLEVTNPKLAARTGALRFFSANYRLFNLPRLETECEDYGQAVIYKGAIKDHPMRFAPHFEFIGDFTKHYGIFEGYGGGLPFNTALTVKFALKFGVLRRITSRRSVRRAVTKVAPRG
jgi:arsenite methyltransferase